MLVMNFLCFVVNASKKKCKEGSILVAGQELC